MGILLRAGTVYEGSCFSEDTKAIVTTTEEKDKKVNVKEKWKILNKGFEFFLTK